MQSVGHCHNLVSLFNQRIDSRVYQYELLVHSRYLLLPNAFSSGQKSHRGPKVVVREVWSFINASAISISSSWLFNRTVSADWCLFSIKQSGSWASCCRMIAAFGSGASYSLVSGITQGNRYQGAFTTGVLFAAFQGALHKASPLLHAEAFHLGPCHV